MASKQLVIPPERIEHAILLIRGQKVVLSPDLAALYDVEPRTLIQAVKRNLERFPKDFMFQLTWDEVKALRSQFVILDGVASGRTRSQFGHCSNPTGADHRKAFLGKKLR